MSSERTLQKEDCRVDMHYRRGPFEEGTAGAEMRYRRVVCCGGTSDPEGVVGQHSPVGSLAANSGAEASAVKMPSRPCGASDME